MVRTKQPNIKTISSAEHTHKKIKDYEKNQNKSAIKNFNIPVEIGRAHV